MGKREREKGARAEREFVRELGQYLAEPLARNLAQTRDGGADIVTGDFHIEVKRQEKPRLGAWWKQTIQQAGEKVPVLAFRRSREPWMVLVGMSVQDFAKYTNTRAASS